MSLSPIPYSSLTPREPVPATRPERGAGISREWISRFEQLEAACSAAGLTARQSQVVRLTCHGKSLADIAVTLKISAECAATTLRGAVKKLDTSRQLSAGDRAAVLRAVQGRKERDGDPEWDASCHQGGESQARVQGMRPFGMAPEDLDAPNVGPTRALLEAVCKLTGSRMPRLEVLAQEAPRPVKAELAADGITWVKQPA